MKFVIRVRRVIRIWIAVLDLIAIATIIFGSLPWAAIMTAVAIANSHIFARAVVLPVKYFKGIETFSNSEKLDIIFSVALNSSYNGFDSWKEVNCIQDIKCYLFKNAVVVKEGRRYRIKGFMHIWSYDSKRILELLAEYLDVPYEV